MRNRWQYLRPICGYLGVLIVVFGLLMLVPLVVRWAFVQGGADEVPAYTFWLPAVAAVALGTVLKGNLKFPPLDTRRAMVLCALGWIVVSAVGAVPFSVGLGLGYLDAYFETVSGFTTTGITMLSGLDDLPASILFWRAFTQWLGGLGILTFFLTIIFTGGSAHHLYTAESHKVFSQRPAPGLLNTLRILWTIYTVFTVLIAAALVLEGLGLFDAVTHAMTTLSTGGYSPHDASVGYFRQAGYAHFTLIEYTLIIGMLLGGINFLVHYRVLTGGVRALWDTTEMRLWWVLLVGATVLVMVERLLDPASDVGTIADLHEVVRTSLFQVVAVATTTGFGTKDIGSAYFGAAARQVFLVLMIVGGCVGSTSGGFKVLRIAVLFKMLGRQLRRLVYGPAAVHPLVLDNETIDTEELRRIAALFFAWVVLLAAGAVVTALLSNHGAVASASGMFSALGNIGPCYISVPEMNALHPLIKIVYIFGMLAGRLEILPLLLLFSRRTWR